MREFKPTEPIIASRLPDLSEIAPPEVSDYGHIHRELPGLDSIEAVLIEECEAARKTEDAEMLALAEHNLRTFRQLRPHWESCDDARHNQQA